MEEKFHLLQKKWLYSVLYRSWQVSTTYTCRSTITLFSTVSLLSAREWTVPILSTLLTVQIVAFFEGPSVDIVDCLNVYFVEGPIFDCPNYIDSVDCLIVDIFDGPSAICID